MSKKKIIITGIVFLGLAGGGWFFYNRSVAAKAAVPAAMPTPVEKVGRATIITEVSAKGEVDLQDTELVYTNTVAEAEDVPVKKGDEVKKGQVLIRYKEKSLEDLHDQLSEAKLNLQTAQLALDAARLTDVKDSVKESARLQVLTARQAIETRSAGIEERESSLKTLREDIGKAEKDYEDKKLLHDVGALARTELEQAEKELQTLQTQLKNDTSSLELEKARLTNDENALSLAERQYEETLNPDKRIEDNAIASAEITLQKSRLQVEKIQKEIEDFQNEILSPIDGTLTQVNVSKGEVTPTDKVLMEVSNLERYVVRLEVRERDAPSIKEGMEATVSSPVFGSDTYKGTVTKIGGMAELKSTSSGTEKIVPVELTMDSAAPLLKPGYSMEAVIVTKTSEDAVVVPILATLSERNGSNYVYVVKEDNTLEKRVVKLGSFSDLTVEAEGIEEGEIIVSQPVMGMDEGSVITPIGLEAAGGEEQ